MAFDLTGFAGLFEIGGKLIDRIFPDKIAQQKERDAAELALLQMTKTGELEDLKLRLSAILAEAQSSDPWTSRARPSFMYVMYIMILFALPMGFLAAFRPDIASAVASGMQAWLKAIPEALYALFGVGYTGYAVSRSYEKAKGVAK